MKIQLFHRVVDGYARECRDVVENRSYRRKRLGWKVRTRNSSEAEKYGVDNHSKMEGTPIRHHGNVLYRIRAMWPQ